MCFAKCINAYGCLYKFFGKNDRTGIFLEENGDEKGKTVN